ncbi:MAG: DinB family protein [Chloroflexi bacterium]|nr:DinB family protein [Chloroflexota bacterium]MCY3581221.1 DinB family protein [Chloroflexota bacterium]MCY3715072.1 DinB family protein [Chloroflexota bacterium]MDE2652103.1 DinB family protein [Chloroflexota bacterium]MXX82041.1 DinB family protein [Chloroflexota bacterium]
MIDFTPMRDGEISFMEYAARETIGPAQLRALSDESLDFLLSQLDGLTDADIVFEPEDPDANDPFAVEGEEDIGWNFGHLIVHVTASSEEGAALSSLLARGVPASERPRYETPWREMQTVAQVRQRLEESRRMRNAYLETWPQAPLLDTVRAISERFTARFGQMNAPAAFLFGLSHEVGHFAQIEEVRRQALAARPG